MTEWKSVTTKGDDWLVSIDGKIKTPAHKSVYTRTRNGKTQIVESYFPECEIAPHISANGYLYVKARKNGKRISAAVHRLIGIAFVSGYSPELTINHINGDKLDNRIENLEWVSLAKNTKHQWETGLVNLRGENQPTSKLTSKQVVYIRKLLLKGISAHALSVIAGVSASAIDNIKHGKSWKG